MSPEIAEVCEKMRKDGKTYHDISIHLWIVYAAWYSEEQIRYATKRKFIPRRSPRQRLMNVGKEKVLVFSDQHIPFNIDIISIVEKHKDEISLIIIGGDLVDCAEISKFPSLGKFDLQEEMITAHQILTEISHICPNIKIILIKGNHEVRWEKELAIKGGTLKNLHSNNILKEICGGFNIYDHRKKIETKYQMIPTCEVIDTWYYKYKDLIVCHPISFSNIEGRTGALSVDYFTKQGENFSAIYVGHTHKQDTGWRYKKFFAEIGCTCVEQDYANSGKLNYTPCQQGYAIATFTNGRYDFNDSKVVIINEPRK